MNPTESRSIDADTLLGRYPAADPAAAARLLKEELAASPHKIVMLDDDPTGVQTVQDISVYTRPDADSVAAGFGEPGRLFCLLTNSRALPEDETVPLHRDIAQHVARASEQTGRPFLLVSRSDSTLRGHYPAETEALRQGLSDAGQPDVDMEVLCPFFEEGGRLTVDGVHYVRSGDDLIPAGQTEYAEDPLFGYRASDLRQWVAEKTGGAVAAADVTVLTLQELRRGDVDAVAARLMDIRGFAKVVVDAAEDADAQVAAAALLRAARQGRTMLLRTGAGLVRALSGVPKQAPLSPDRLLADAPDDRVGGGLVVVGSHVGRTTRQLAQLIATRYLTPVELDVTAVAAGRSGPLEQRLSAQIERMLSTGRSVVLYTSRTRLTGKDADAQRGLSAAVSDALVRVVAGISRLPRFLVAKGGITASDIGVKALNVQRAEVIGQAMAGVPVWKLGPESRFPDLPYVIYPGNVGDDDALARLVRPLLWGHGNRLEDFVRDPSLLPESLPEVLADADGVPLKPEDWPRRRAEILDFFARNVYGVMPEAPEQQTVDLMEVRDLFGSKATHSTFRITMDTPSRPFSFPFHLVVPLGVVRPPVFLQAGWSRGLEGLYTPAEEIVDRGYALATFCYEDIAPDADDGFKGGLAGCYPIAERTPETWGKISLWAFAAHRVMDALQRRDDIDPGQVAVIGHSRLGKTALWAGATDDRFALVAYNAPGCGGSAITRGKKGEHIRNLTGSFGHWLCANYAAFAEDEDHMPFDQHFLLATIAPRPQYNGSALQDEWSDPLAEYLGCLATDPVYRMLGRPGLEGLEVPDTTDPVHLNSHDGDIGFHLREGMHFFSRTDWRQVMDFWDRKRAEAAGTGEA